MLEGVTKPDRQTLGYGGAYKDKDKKIGGRHKDKKNKDRQQEPKYGDTYKDREKKWRMTQRQTDRI